MNPCSKKSKYIHIMFEHLEQTKTCQVSGFSQRQNLVKKKTLPRSFDSRLNILRFCVRDCETLIGLPALWEVLMQSLKCLKAWFLSLVQTVSQTLVKSSLGVNSLEWTRGEYFGIDHEWKFWNRPWVNVLELINVIKKEKSITNIHPASGITEWRPKGCDFQK